MFLILRGEVWFEKDQNKTFNKHELGSSDDDGNIPGLIVQKTTRKSTLLNNKRLKSDK